MNFCKNTKCFLKENTCINFWTNIEDTSDKLYTDKFFKKFSEMYSNHFEVSLRKFYFKLKKIFLFSLKKILRNYE